MPPAVNVSNGQLHAGPVSAPVIPLILLGIGGYFAWFGVHYWDSDTKWPSDPIKDILQGKGLPTASGQTPASSISSSIAAGSGSSSGSGGTGSGGGGTGSGGGGGVTTGKTAQQNQNTARLLAAPYGWGGGDEFNALIKLWNQESGWNNLALNSGSGAFGIAQALGHGGNGTTGKYGNQYPSLAANNGDPTAQISWGLQYIQQRYGDPIAAWAFETSHVPNWY